MQTWCGACQRRNQAAAEYIKNKSSTAAIPVATKLSLEIPKVPCAPSRSGPATCCTRAYLPTTSTSSDGAPWWSGVRSPRGIELHTPSRVSKKKRVLQSISFAIGRSRVVLASRRLLVCIEYYNDDGHIVAPNTLSVLGVSR